MNYLVVFSVLFSASFIIPAYAHTTVEVGPYSIEVGWDDEPPVVGYRNAIVYEITESPSEGVKSGVINAFKNLDATIRSGGITKTLDINSDPRPGHYFSKIIPTKTGSLVIEFNGNINGVEVDIEVPIEDVETTAVLDFPPKGSSGDTDIAPIKNALSSLQNDVIDLKSKVGDVDTSSAEFNTEAAYNFGVFGLSLGAAGVILAIIAMIKRK